jgi:hypothetical protein
MMQDLPTCRPSIGGAKQGVPRTGARFGTQRVPRVAMRQQNDEATSWCARLQSLCASLPPASLKRPSGVRRCGGRPDGPAVARSPPPPPPPGAALPRAGRSEACLPPRAEVPLGGAGGARGAARAGPAPAAGRGRVGRLPARGGRRALPSGLPRAHVLLALPRTRAGRARAHVRCAAPRGARARFLNRLRCCARAPGAPARASVSRLGTISVQRSDLRCRASAPLCARARRPLGVFPPLCTPLQYMPRQREESGQRAA